MSDSHSHQPMLAQSAGAAAAGARLPTAELSSDDESLLPPASDPDRVVDEILSHLSAERFQTARRMAREAVERFPDHVRVQRAWVLFDCHGRARVGSGGPEPSTDEEFAWLEQPPEWARGKWVALVGSEAVASADTLAEVLRVIRSKKFSKRPLVHRIADA